VLLSKHVDEFQDFFHVTKNKIEPCSTL